MSKNYDIDHELKDAIKEALTALMTTPDVGMQYEKKHQEAQTKAYERLKDAKANSDVF